MKRFSEENIKETVFTLLNGGDYRTNVINSINTEFLDFTVSFFKKVVDAKMEDTTINLDWYKQNFLNKASLKPSEIAIHAGMNSKTINNIYGSASREVIIQIANQNFDYLSQLISILEEDQEKDWDILIKLTHKRITVELSLTESLLVVNVLATKKIAIRGGAWSSIGKNVEKPLMIELCCRCGVLEDYIDSTNFVKDKTKKIDREVDFKLKNKKKNKEYKIEVKLMGKGNPESADVLFARDSKIIIADTLSDQNKNQIQNEGRFYLELKNNQSIIEDFKAILKELDIPFQ